MFHWGICFTLAHRVTVVDVPTQKFTILYKETSMNSDIFSGKWKQLKGSLQSQWGKLTDNDLDRIDGNYDQLIGMVQERYGKDKAQAKKEVEEFLDAL
tara:strand:- start:3595 stop:3888 length:294 start_codon:yes stop_codon:yes gene_type:complete